MGFKFRYSHLESGGDKCFAVVYNFPHLGLVGFCGILCCGLEVVSLYELLYFGLVL